MPKKPGGVRVFGPYEHGRQWRIVRSERGARVVEAYATREAAERARDEILAAAAAALEAQTVKQAIDAYLAHRADLGHAEGSRTTTGYRLRALLDGDLALDELTPRRAELAYEARRKKVSTTTALNELGEARTFGKWMERKRLVRRNPFAQIEGVGERSAGKPQLRLDDARALWRVCLKRAGKGEDSALAVAVALAFGIRASEVLALTARDLDDGGRVLRVTRKKKRSRLVVEGLAIPDVLQPLLAARAEAVKSGALWPGRTRDWLRYHCQRLCRKAGVEEISTHGLRGSLSSGLVAGGATAELVAALLGHNGTGVAQRHYIAGDVAASARHGQRLKVLAGGKR